MAEKVARTGEHLTTDYPLICKVVSVDNDIVQCSRLAFDNSHLYIDRVAFNVKFYRLDIEEEITIVTIKLGDVVFSLLSASEESLFHCHDIIDISFLNLENFVERLRTINRVSCPCNVPEIILLSFIDIEIDLNTARLYIIHSILHDSCISVTCFVKGTYERPLVVIVLAFIEFLGAEEVLWTLVPGLLHGTYEFRLLYVFSTIERDLLDLYLFTPVNRELHAYGTADHGILLGVHIHLYIKETFLLIVSLDDIGCSLCDIVGKLSSTTQIDSFLELLLFSALDSAICPA